MGWNNAAARRFGLQAVARGYAGIPFNAAAMTNRLAGESSPYLLQHAHNPVDWYPWGEEALARARAENRPILLSVGYSACHWCHVMERESFSDPATAELMNRLFVNIKVDREERPDVDQIYMKAVQALTGSGGWPLTVFLTPDGGPFYGGTYFPPQPRHGMPAFRQVLEAAAAAWRDRPSEVQEAARKLVEAASARPTAAPARPPGASSALQAALGALRRQYDAAHGGFGRAPKFPQPVTLEVLARARCAGPGEEAERMLLHTLRAMAAGGIRDHLGGGFHRYSVDEAWRVPHFEKMLYDNALLARAYLDAHLLTGAEDLRAVAEDTLDYVLEDLRAPEGGFYAARDADSEGEEGRHYLWELEEVHEALGDDAQLFAAAFGVTRRGEVEGRSVLRRDRPLEALAAAAGIDPHEAERRLEAARRVLLQRRDRRPPPFRDEKILVSWNGFAIRALAEAGAALARPDYVDAARDAADFLLTEARPDGRLRHVWTTGTARVDGFLEDHAALGNALLSLHEATLDPSLLAPVAELVEEILSRFLDAEDGVFHDTAHDAERLVMRPRDPMDNATPSGPSLAAEFLVRAGHLLGRDDWTDAARRAIEPDREAALRFPTAFGRLISVLDRLEAEPVEVVLIGHAGDPGLQAMMQAAAGTFHRNRTITGGEPGVRPPLPVPLLEGRTEPRDVPAAYVCRNRACLAPVHTAGEVAAALRDL